ncbi:MAG: hypothetical protein NT003_03410 [Candidatus Magasanikbacteria bacterium]|nr:hypothetical protein [Candidatus Magasanikbacteria bacterium]
MKLKYFILPAAFLLVGAGCEQSQPIATRPVSPQPQVVEKTIEKSVAGLVTVGLGGGQNYWGRPMGSMQISSDLSLIAEAENWDNAVHKKSYQEISLTVAAKDAMQAYSQKVQGGEKAPPFFTIQTFANPESYKDAATWAKNNSVFADISKHTGVINDVQLKAADGSTVKGISFSNDNEMYAPTTEVVLSPLGEVLVITKYYSGGDAKLITQLDTAINSIVLNTK